MKPGLLLVLAMVVAGVAGAVFDSYRHPVVEVPAVVGTMPQFELLNSDGQLFRSSQLAGKPAIINFFFSQCQGICPLMNSKVAALHRRFQGKLHVVSISIDPEHDTPEVLKAYREKFRLDSPDWVFLTGPKSTLDPLVNDGFKLTLGETPEVHSGRVVLVDGDGGIRGFYDGTEVASMAELSQVLEGLLVR